MEEMALARAATLYTASNGRGAFAEVPAGTALTVDAGKNSFFQGTNWVAVAVPRHLSVWVHGDLAPGGKVAMNNTHVRAGAGTQFNSLGMVAKGTELEVRGSLGEWLRVAPPGTARTWVDAALLKPLPAPPPPPSAPVATANTEDAEDAEETPKTDPRVEIEIPAALAGVLLSQTHEQGRAVEISGIADWPAAQHWNIPANALVQTPGGETYLVSADGPADEWMGAKVTVRGTLWRLAGHDTPLVVADELTAHPFSLGGQ